MTIETKAQNAIKYFTRGVNVQDGIIFFDIDIYLTICQALTLLDEIQSGNLKALCQEPTRTMKHAGYDYNVGPLSTRASFVFQAMWDAAEPIGESQ